MFNLSKEQSGWAQAFINVLIFWGISNIFMAYSTQILEVNKVIFALTTYASCSFCLLAYAGHGKLSKESMRSIDTWLYGIIMLLNYFITLNLFSLTTATEASLIQRFSVIFSVLTSWFFLARNPSKYQIVGVIFIFASVLFIINNSPQDKIFYLYILMILGGTFQSLRIFVAEYHRPNKQASEDKSIKTRCRVIGYVMFVITLIFGLLVISASFMAETVPDQYKKNLVITLADLFSYKSIITGFIMGIFIYTPIRYLEFSASEKIKTENYMAVTALSFLSTMFWEWSTSGLTGLSLKEFTPEAFLAGLVITASALMMALSKIFIKDSKKEYSEFLVVDPQNIDDIEESREIIANTLEHFESDSKKAAKALGVSEKILNAILTNKEKNIAFNHIILKQVAKNYRKNVSQCDALTGLLNRNGFMTALKTASYEASHLSLYFIDLNKFKPVNDTYGHEAGDFILKQVGDRLRNLFENNSLITRLGGDEYCILLIGVDKKSAQSKIKRITAELEKDFSYESNLINISGSIGLACYPEDTKDPQSLLDLADKQMYVNKSER